MLKPTEYDKDTLTGEQRVVLRQGHIFSSENLNRLKNGLGSRGLINEVRNRGDGIGCQECGGLAIWSFFV